MSLMERKKIKIENQKVQPPAKQGAKVPTDLAVVRKAVYPGTFDPITLGHIDVVKRGLGLFDELVIGVTTSPSKKPFFSLQERFEMVQQSVKDLKGVEVKTFESLLVDFVKKEKARVILRGLREASDFPSEFSQSIVNRKLEPKIETVFVMTNPDYFYVNSSAVREIAFFGGNISDFVPAHVKKMVMQKMGKK